ncbi:hypothetical protein J8J27_27590, partial [Mycobacterium tuberculosis]|nr:hypothetical protein [Mycobacterium tuberculosis]
MDLPNRALTAAYAIVGLVAATLVFVLALAAGGEGDSAAVRRLERFDWRMILLIGIVGGYAVGHAPFGPSELVLDYLVMRGFAPP